MTNTNLFDAAYQVALAADKATDGAVHEDVAKIVKLHAKIAIASAFIPVPGADIAAMATNTWTMYVRINKALGIPFSENIIKSLASGIATNLLSVVPAMAVGEMLKFIPGVGTLAGSAIMAGSLYTITIAAGIVYMRALAMILKQKSELTEVNLQAVVDALVGDKNTMKQIVKDAKKESKLAQAAGEFDKN
jgi:uncharacterized protein (DUF697 family)